MTLVPKLLLRAIGLAVGIAAFWYSSVLGSAENGVVGMAQRHGTRHADEPSKAAAGGSLLAMLTDLFAMGALFLGIAFVAASLFPWSMLIRRMEKARGDGVGKKKT